MKLKIFTDGGARGNPGPAGIGVVIYDTAGKIIFKQGKCIGKATNNAAEYEAVILALAKAKELGATELDMNLDSELVVEQLKGHYKVKNPDLAKLFLKVWNLTQRFKKINYKHVYREQNKLADELVNNALDNKC
ncbi:MAG: ribonuclease HI family protein [Parcubacteria group bacterium]